MTTKINSTNETLQYLYSLSLDKSNFRFRGQANYDWTLLPTIYRYSNFLRYQTVAYESHLLEVKPKTISPPLTHTTYDLEWLMVCQHYGVPTRLLDWTTDILTALFFACSSTEEKNEDGAIFICNQDDYPMFSAYNEHARETQNLAFISTNIINPRVRMQSGCFMIWGHAPLNDKSTESYDLWEYHKKEKHTHSLTKICIPKKSKKEILKELKGIYSISDTSLYLKNGYLEKKFLGRFEELKENARLMTVYRTDADQLTHQEEKKARSMFRIECRNMLGSCVNLTNM